jgi:colicin import membrane protein
MQGIVDKYQALILESIRPNWLVPYNVNKNLTSVLMIRVAPGGMVLDVQIVKSSGDAALDRSARAAIFKASPLPVPEKSDEFELFRQFTLKMKPENIAALS